MKNSSNHVFWLQILNFENCVLTILRITSCFCCSTQLFQNGTNEGPMRVLYDNQWLYVFSHRRSWWDLCLITFLVVIYIFFSGFLRFTNARSISLRNGLREGSTAFVISSLKIKLVLNGIGKNKYCCCLFFFRWYLLYISLDQ